MSSLVVLTENLREIAQNTVSAAFQLDRLEYLAERSNIFALVYAELIIHLDYCIIQGDYAHNRAVIDGEMQPVIEIAGFNFPLTLEGRKSAMAKAFEHAANQIDRVLALDSLKTLMLSMDTVVDLVKAGLTASRTMQYQGMPRYRSRIHNPNNPGRPPKKWFDKMVKAINKGEVDDPNAVVGDIWHNQLSESKRQEILRRYE